MTTATRLRPGAGGVFTVSAQLWRADRYGRRIEQVASDVPVQGTIEYNQDVQIKRKLTMEVSNPHRLRPWRDWIIPVFTLADGSGYVETRPKGHYLVTPPSTEHWPGRFAGSFEARDVCILLAQWAFAGPSAIPAGANAGAAAREIALQAGVAPAQMNLPDTSFALAEDYQIDPGDSALFHINELYNRASWYTVWSDDFGVIRTAPYQLLAETAPALTLSTHEGRARIVPPIKGDPDWGRLRNRVTVRNLPPDRDPIYYTADVVNPDHPLFHDPDDPDTFPLIVAGEPVDDPQIETVEQAKALAEMLLDQAASFHSRLTVQSVVDLGCDAHQVVELDVLHENTRYGGRWLRRAWFLELAGAKGIISSELNRAERWT